MLANVANWWTLIFKRPWCAIVHCIYKTAFRFDYKQWLFHYDHQH